MPVESFLKTVLIVLSPLAILFILAVQYSVTLPTIDINNHATYEQSAMGYFNVAYAFVIFIFEWFKDFDHDDWIAASSILIAAFTCCLWWSTSKLWKAGKEQIGITKTTADAAKTSADASLVALRPWLSCEVKAVGPLKFSKGDAVFKFTFIVKNVGHSPAMGVRFMPHITLLSPKHEPAILWLKKMAEHNRYMPVEAVTILLPSGVNLGTDETGLVLFPNEPNLFNYILQISHDEIEKSCEDLKTNKYIMPIVCGLVTYNYSLAHVRADTGFAYPIRKKSGQTKTTGVFYLNKSVPQNKLILDTDFSGNGFAT